MPNDRNSGRLAAGGAALAGAKPLARAQRAAAPTGIPWQERPADCQDVVWRHTGNPVIGRRPLPDVLGIYNSAVVPYGDGFAGAFRVEDRTRALLAGYQVHIAKPVAPHELIVTVASAAGRTGPT